MNQELTTRNGYRLFALTLVLNALGAYSLFGVPMQWMSQVLTIYLFMWIGFKSNLRLAPGMVLFVFLFVYALLVTSYKSVTGDYYRFIPPKATTSYFPYLALRFFTFASFGAIAFATYWLLLRGYRKKVLEFLALLCLYFSLAALYIYVAQTYGLPEPPRSRVGTSGGEQMTTFTYAFHRAMGTFREPSHLAEWLILPLLVTLTQKGWKFTVARVVGITTLFLTGSLTGMGAILGGLASALIVLFAYMSADTFRALGRLATVIFVGLFGFGAAVGGAKGEVDLFGVLWARIEPILNKGAGQSNRNYVVHYFEQQEIEWFGVGLGNSNLKFTNAIGVDSTVAFLNIFLNFALSLGYIGLGVFLLFLLTPFVILFSNRRYKYESDHFMILAAFFGWIIAFSVHSEELSIPFGVTYALLVHSFAQQKPAVQPT